MAQANTTASMKQLTENRRSLGPACGAQFPEPRNNPVTTRVKKGFFETVAGMQGHAFQDDQTHPAPGPGFVISNQVIGHHPIVTQSSSMGRIENPVSDPGRSQGDGLLKIVVHGRIMLDLVKK